MSWCLYGRSEWGAILTQLVCCTLQHNADTNHTESAQMQGYRPQQDYLHLRRQRRVEFPGQPLPFWPSGYRFGFSGAKRTGLQQVWSGLRAEKKVDWPRFLLWLGVGDVVMACMLGKGLVWFESSVSAKGGNASLSHQLVLNWSTMGRGRGEA